MAAISTDLSSKNKIASIPINDYRIVPIVFLPGIMGSNLKNNRDKVIWRYDDSLSLLGWSLPSSGPKERKKLLHPDKVQVDNRGVIISSQQQEQYDQEPEFYGSFLFEVEVLPEKNAASSGKNVKITKYKFSKNYGLSLEDEEIYSGISFISSGVVR